MLKKLCMTIAAGAFVAALMPAAQAMPAAPLAGVTGAEVIQVAGGCGRGWHRNRYGRCVPNRVYCKRVWIQGRGWRTVCR